MMGNDSERQAELCTLCAELLLFLLLNAAVCASSVSRAPGIFCGTRIVVCTAGRGPSAVVGTTLWAWSLLKGERSGSLAVFRIEDVIDGLTPQQQSTTSVRPT